MNQFDLSSFNEGSLATAEALSGLPDLVVAVATSPETGEIGNTLEVSWTVTNQGTETATADWYDYVFLSDNTIYDGSDRSLGYFYTSAQTPLAAGASYSQTQNITLPGNAATGNYYLIFVTDRDNYQDETNQTNNFYALPITLKAPDITITTATAPIGADLGTNIQVSWTVTNQGEVTAAADWYDYIYLSDDLTYDSTDTFVSYFWTGSNTPITPGASYTQTQNITIPNSVKIGSRYLLFVSDRDNYQTETNESNNVYAVPITLNSPDLTVTQATVSQTTGLTPGATVSVSWTVDNSSSITALADWYDYIFLSDDATYDNSDRSLGYQWVGASTPLAGGTSYTQTRNITLPTTDVLGQRYLLFIADRDNYQSESNEANNVYAVPITFGNSGSDLRITTATAPTTVVLGETVSLSWSVTNQGDQSTSGYSWYDYFYWSEDATLDDKDIYISYEYVGEELGYQPLAASGNYTATRNLTIPNNAPLGNRYLLIVSDGSRNQTELNEANNVYALPIAITAPDLTVTSVTAPTEATLQEGIEISWTVINQGTVNAPTDWYDYLYLSDDTTYDNSDTFVSYFYTGSQTPLAAGASYTQTQTVTIPNSKIGDRYLLLVTDRDNYQGETNEVNNTYAIPITFKAPDLTVTAGSAPVAGELGNSIQVSWTVTNQGSTTAWADWYDYIYLSDDAIYDNSDNYVTYFYTGSQTPLAAGQSYTQTQNLTLPNNVTVGSRYLIFVADRDNYQGETNENNNFYAVPITLNGPDLTVTTASINQTGNITPGSTVTASWTVTNQGSVTANGSWYDYIYLSGDTVYDNTDTYLSYAYPSGNLPLASGGSYTLNQSITLPSDAVGSRYLLFITDRDRYQGESNEANNVYALPISFTGTGSDLTLTSATTPTTGVLGEQIAVSWTVTNQGTQATTNNYWYDYFYLSSDTTLDDSDITLTYEYTGDELNSQPLAAGGSYTVNRTISLANDAAIGASYILFVADRDRYEKETNEANNVYAASITLTAPDLIVSNATAPTTALPGEQIQLSWTVTNQGNASAVRDWLDYIYLSTNASLDNEDTLLKEVNTGSLTPLQSGGQYSITQNLTLGNLTPGSYYLLFATDRYDYQPESNDNNNLYALQIAIGNQQPDLVVSEATAPSTAIVGDTINLAWTVTNTGITSAPADWSDTVYLSEDDIFDSNDIAVFSQSAASNTPLGAGNSYNVNQNIILPNFTLGQRYLLFVADSGKEQLEQNETNNVRAVSINLTAPDLIVTAGNAPTAATWGETIEISWTVRNQGTVTAPADWFDYVYLSNDTVLDTNDLSLGSLGTNTQTPLAVGANYSQSLSITVPSVVQRVGNQYLLLVADGGNNQGETNEGNNVYALDIEIQAPNLTITNTTASEAASLNEAIAISWTVTNQGTGTALSDWYDTVYLSTDTTFDSSDIYLTEQWAGTQSPLAAAASYTANATVTIPRVTGGNYYLLFRSDRYNGQAETDETDNIFAKAIAIGVPDLTVTNVTAPTAASRGETIAVSWTVENIGGSVAPADWYDYFYLSDDQVLDSSDTYLGLANAATNSPLSAGGNYTATVDVQISANTTGDKYLLVVADGYNQQGESDETNNVQASAISISAADLEIQSLDIPTNASFGSTLNLTWTISNTGNGTATRTWRDRFYFSQDNVISADDIFLKEVDNSGTPLEAGSSYTQSTTVTLPLSPNLADGDYYILLQTDPYNNQPEINENNLATGSISLVVPPTPDLIASSISAPATELSGRRIQVSWRVSNLGTAAATGTWYDRVFLSTNDVIGDSDDIVFGTFAFTGTILAGESITRTQEITLPIDASGDRFILVQTDTYNQIYEHTEENNNTAIATTPINIQLSPFPNLQISSITPPTSAFSASQTQVSWTVTNTGDAATNSIYWYEQIWLSQDDILDGQGDYYLGYAYNPTYLNPGESYSNTQTVTLPRSVEGDWRFIIKADAGNQVYEYLNETDNLGVSAPTTIELTPPPDLRVASVTIAPTSPFSGQQVTVNWTVTNAGEGRTFPNETSWYDELFIAKSSDGSGESFSLGRFIHNGTLQSGDSYTVSQTVNLPIGKWQDYFFIVKSDIYNQVYESAFEDNNVGFFDADKNDDVDTPTTIRLTPPPDLVVTAVNTAANAVAGKILTINYQVSNQGASAVPTRTPYWTDAFYLSSTTTFNPNSAIYLGRQSRNGILDTGEFYNNTVSFTLANEISGNYYVFVVTDEGQNIFEQDDVDTATALPNIVASANPVAIVSRPADLVVSNLVAPPTVTAGKTARISWTVVNEGTGDTIVTRWRDRLIASVNDLVGDEDDVEIESYSRNTGILLPGGTYTQTQDILIPFSLVGNYNLFVVTDSDRNVYEATKENNNSSIAYPITINRQTPDLEITSIDIPTTAVSGSPITVSWTVKNSGEGTTNVDYWYDEIFLSSDLTLDNNDILLNTIRRSGTLAPQNEYTGTTEVNLAPNLSGDYYVIVRTDSYIYYGSQYNRVVEISEDNNTFVATAPTTLTLNPVPDLIVASVDAPVTAISGQSLSLTWTVTNNGADINNKYWYDAVYLSRDTIFDRYGGDIYLGAVYRNGDLASGENYTITQSFNLPRGLSGPFYTFVVSDGFNYIDERNGESNNLTYDASATQLILAPPADLVPDGTSISLPSNAISGQTITINYTVNNLGGDSALGGWSDALYLSTDNQWDINDKFIGLVQHYGDVASGESYSESLTAVVPGATPGDYYVLLRSDIRNQIPETIETNNTATSLGTVAVDFESLTIGDSVTGTLAQGKTVYYKIEASAGQALRLQLDGEDDNAANELYIRYGEVPTRGQFDRTADNPFLADPDFVVPIEQDGTYYVMVYGNSATGTPSYTLTATDVPFEISQVDTPVLGNIGQGSIKVKGARFEEGTTFQLIDSQGNLINQLQDKFADSTLNFVTFNLTDVATGSYSLKAIQTDGSSTIFDNAVTVTEGVGASISSIIDGPSRVWAGTKYPINVNYGNNGDTDSVAPLILVRTDNAAVGLTPRYDANEIKGKMVQLFGVGSDIGLEQLRPGESHSIPVYFTSFASNTEEGSAIVDSVNIYNTNLISNEDWQLLKDSARPTDVSATDWDNFWATVQPGIGVTWGDYTELVSELSAAYNQPGERVYDVSELFGRWYDDTGASAYQFQPKSTISGRLLDENGNPLSGKEIQLYRVNEDGTQTLVTETTSYSALNVVTDDNGYFSISSVDAGNYNLSVGTGDRYFNPVERLEDFSFDDIYRSITVTEGSNISNLDLTTYAPSTGADAEYEYSAGAKQVTLIEDASGISHLFWKQGIELWHAYYSNGKWVGAAPIENISPAARYSVQTTTSLVDGSPGLIITWDEYTGDEGGTDIFYALGRAKAGGGFEWSNQLALTSKDDISDANPDLLFTENGQPLIVYQKSKTATQDDTDLYYNFAGIPSSGLTWSSPEGLASNASFGNSGGYNFSTGVEFKLPAPIYGYDAFKLTGGLQGKTTNTCDKATDEFGWNVRLELSTKQKVAGDEIAGQKIFGSGSGSGATTWSRKGNGPYEFDSSKRTGGGSVGIEDYDVIGKLPAPVSTSIALVNSIANFFANGSGVEAGLYGNFSFTGSSSKSKSGQEKFSASATLGGGGFIKFKLAGGLDPKPAPLIEVKGSLGMFGSVTNTTDYQTTELSGRIGARAQIELKIPILKINNFVKFDGISSSAFVEWFIDFPGCQVTINTNQTPLTSSDLASLGTTDVYGNNAVSLTVSQDIYNDGAPILAQGADGRPVMTWVQQGSPEEGNQIVVSQFDGIQWSAPVTVAGGGLMTGLDITTDVNGRSLVVWTTVDPNFTYNETVENLEQFSALMQAASAATNVYYATQQANGTWSAPILLRDLGGADSNVQFGQTNDGTTVVTWINKSGGTHHLMSSFWNGTTWSDPTEVVNGNVSQASVGQVGDQDVVFWSQRADFAASDDPYAEEIYYSVLDTTTGLWSSATLFAPQVAVGGQSLSPVPGSNLITLPGGAGGPGSPPSDCPCETEDGEYCPPPLRSADPNDILGPIGFGPENWIVATQSLDYTIRFENMADATAPAKQVTITQQLDSDLDWRSFRLNSFSWGDLVFQIPENRAFYSERIDVREQSGIYVDVSAFVDITTGVASWELRAIDPETGDLPTDPLKGFLPPNVIQGEGEGYVSYRIKAKNTVQTGDRLDAVARIVFDNNEPIDTPAIFNTLDVSSPNSVVEPLPAETLNPEILLKWSGSDDLNGSGIASYDVYVAKDDGAFELFLRETALTEATYTAEAGHTYTFYSLARDNAGNLQSSSNTLPMTITVGGPGILEFSTPTFTVAEDGTAIAAVTINRTNGSSGEVGVNLSLGGGTATAGIDYNNEVIAVTFADSETSKVVTIPVIDDDLAEGEETVNLSLSSPTGGAILGQQSTSVLTVLDETVQLNFSSPSFKVNEDGTLVSAITITRSGFTSGEVSATLNFDGGTATATEDYDSSPILVTFADGETSKIITLPVVDDSLAEGDEIINLRLTNPTGGAAIGSQGNAVLTLADDDVNLRFNLTSEGSLPAEAIAGFTQAASRWSLLLNNSAIINITVGFQDLGSSILAQNIAERENYSYSDVYNALVANATSSDDLSAVNSLQSGSALSLLINRTSDNPNGFGSDIFYLDNNENANNNTIYVNRANAKALGLLDANDSERDDLLIFNSNSNLTWDFDPSDGISAGTYDFVGLATHEIGHTLGFDSGVDVLDINPSSLEEEYTYVTPLDLFRFSSDSVAYGSGVIDWTASTSDKYFSLDGGVTKLGSFATGVNSGDGSQAGHWKDSLGLGLMNPTIAPGERLDITDLDKQAFDVIGWNL